MAQDYAKAFYKSKEWIRCKEAYLKSVGRLCERCLKEGYITPADVVHHKIHITPENINDPSITVNSNNLMALCMDCHAAVHKKEKRWKIDDTGHVIIPPYNNVK